MTLQIPMSPHLATSLQLSHIYFWKHSPQYLFPFRPTMAIEDILENSKPLQIQKRFENVRLLLQNKSESWAGCISGKNMSF